MDIHIHVIPAQPGLRVIERHDHLYDDGGIVINIGLPIIAWRVETDQTMGGGYRSSCIPLTATGDVKYLAGILHTDGSVSSNKQYHYINIDKFMADCYPNAKLINTTEEKRSATIPT